MTAVPHPPSPFAPAELRLGVDVLPTRCSGCASAMLSVDPPMGGQPVSTLTCGACGRVLAHLLPPPTRAVAPARPPTPLSEQDWRLPGCSTPQCRRGAHNPLVHESFARGQALAEVARLDAQPTGVLRTGPIAIDFDVIRVTVDGRNIGLSVNETRIMLYLAARIGRTCPHAEIARSVWDDQIAEIWGVSIPGHGAWHVIRVNVARMRRKLGAASTLVETVKGFGFRLIYEPPMCQEESGGNV